MVARAVATRRDIEVLGKFKLLMGMRSVPVMIVRPILLSRKSTEKLAGRRCETFSIILYF
ncbi:hypothetical protein A6U85_24100 [Agrobacterium sp. 13-626]|nr:hypothetical protein A6U85_24100 [Agrobacterium sp. 13-626]